VNAESLKLTIYYGERDRANGSFLADALAEIFAGHELQTSVVMRGIAGFGAKQHLRTDRLLSLSEDLPLVSVAVDTRERIEAALAQVTQLRFDGLVTLERARMLTGSLDAGSQAQPCCSASTARRTEPGSARGSSAATRTSRS
jgi:PII-like signaling protein